METQKRSGRQRPNLMNNTFGQLKVLLDIEGCDAKHPMWLCQCECGKTCKASSSDLLKGKKTSCPSCGYKRTGGLLWKGEGQISGKFWSWIKHGAKIRNLSFNLTISEAWDLYIKQSKKCALSGEEILIDRANKSTASLDRIDSAKGYILENVQWVHKEVNGMKSNMPEEQFVTWCKKISSYKVKA